MTVLDPLVPTSTGFRVFPSNVRGTIFSAFNPGNTPSPNQNNKSKKGFFTTALRCVVYCLELAADDRPDAKNSDSRRNPYKLLRDSSLKKSPTYQSASPVGFAYK